MGIIRRMKCIFGFHQYGSIVYCYTVRKHEGWLNIEIIRLHECRSCHTRSIYTVDTIGVRSYIELVRTIESLRKDGVVSMIEAERKIDEEEIS